MPITTPDWSIAGGVASLELGSGIASDGDLNGDGFDDVVAGAEGADGVDNDVGAAFVYYGSSAGPSLVPDWSVLGTTGSARLGNAVASAGDLDGDGFDDLVVAASHLGVDWLDEGGLYLYLGSASGPSAAADWSVVSGVYRAFLGSSVATGGDVDGDGIADLLAGAEGYGTYEGGAALYLGSPTGPAATADWFVDSGQQPSWFGAAVAHAGDVDGDGRGDLLVGAYAWNAAELDEGAVFLYLGSFFGPSTAPDWSATSGGRYAYLGSSVAGGDIDGDGFDDLVAGAPGWDDTYDEGALFLWRGSPTGPPATADWFLVADVEGADLGTSLATGDVDADGYDDLLVGADSWKADPFDEAGAVLLFLGSPSLPSPAADWLAADLGVYFGTRAAQGDVDGDGFGDALATAREADGGLSYEGFLALYLGSDSDSDADGYRGWDGTDCDDIDPLVHPGGLETCDGADEDCDGVPDDADSWADADGDGFGDPLAPSVGCPIPGGHVTNDGDCDDLLAAVSPADTERCNAIDDDCDGTVDEPDAVDAIAWYADADGDGFGDPAEPPVVSCTAPAGTVADATDCGDLLATVSPAATELCDGLDDDCDGVVDEPDAADAATWYADTDGDGFGDPATGQPACTVPDGHVSDATDCDDTTSAVHVGATEVCNALDDDCDGTVDAADAADAATWYADGDGDGFGDPATPTVACAPPPGFVADKTDCDDGAPQVNPAATERCDGVDDDCDGTVDEPDAADVTTWYGDGDGDGYGDAVLTIACDGPDGAVADGTDCDDADPAVHPDADERCNALDDDCDREADEGCSEEEQPKGCGCTSGSTPGWLPLLLAVLPAGACRRRTAHRNGRRSLLSIGRRRAHMRAAPSAWPRSPWARVWRSS